MAIPKKTITERHERKTLGVEQVHEVLPSKTTEYIWHLGSLRLHVCCVPKSGTHLLAVSHWQQGQWQTHWVDVSVRSWLMKKVTLNLADDAEKPPLPVNTVLMKKFPRVLEFLTARKYDDGSKRLPGKIFLETDGVAFVMTLKEPTLVAQMRLRAPEFDELWALAHAALSQDVPPWEIDQWAFAKLPKPRKKKEKKD